MKAEKVLTATNEIAASVISQLTQADIDAGDYATGEKVRPDIKSHARTIGATELQAEKISRDVSRMVRTVIQRRRRDAADDRRVQMRGRLVETAQQLAETETAAIERANFTPAALANNVQVGDYAELAGNGLVNVAASSFENRSGTWTPDIDRGARERGRLKCKHCGEGYDQHHPWPELPCPKQPMRPSTPTLVADDGTELRCGDYSKTNWTAERVTDRVCYVYEGRQIAASCEPLDGTQEGDNDTYRRAKLMAAAPDMWRALRKVRDAWQAEYAPTILENNSLYHEICAALERAGADAF